MRRGVVASAGVGTAVLVTFVGMVSAYAAPDKDNLDAALSGLDVTAEMVANSTFDLAEAATNATFDIKPAYSEFPLETTEITDDQTVVTLASDLLFEFGTSDLTDPARAALAEMAKDIPQGAAVSVDGYTDSISGDDINGPLSQARAQTVADALAAARSDLVLTVAGHGSADPVADNTNPDGTDNPVGRALNRRVTLTYATG
jgi:outer membrane protein OmpA-like peptidoglycan-associated protein